MSRIETKKQQDILYLKGELDIHLLDDLWSAQNSMLNGVKYINVGQLTRVDSSGLAILVYFCNKYYVKLKNINPQLQTLITLYDLHSVFDD